MMRHDTHYFCFILFLCVVALCACDAKPDLSKFTPKQFTVDEPGLTYFYQDIKRGQVVAKTLADVPQTHRGAVQLHQKGWPIVKNRAYGAYVANLWDAKNGQKAQATWRSRRHIMGALFAQSHARDRASTIAVVASEMAVVAPNSIRRQQMLKLRKAMGTTLDKEEKKESTEIVIDLKALREIYKNDPDKKKKVIRTPSKKSKRKKINHQNPNPLSKINMVKTFTILGASFGMLSVGLGAFGAHGLKDKVDVRMLEVWATAAQYNMYHALALFAAAWLLSKTDHFSAVAAGIAFCIGIVLFSGSLYAMALTNIRRLGAITPLGGLAFIIGWIALIIAATKLS